MTNTRLPFTSSDWGSYSDMHILFFPYRGSKSDKKFLVQQYHDYIQSHSYPEYVNSDYDCSGHYFGSRWDRLRATFDDYGLSVVVEHSFSQDI